MHRNVLSDRIRNAADIDELTTREVPPDLTLKDSLNICARTEIRKALERNAWQKKVAAQELGLSEYGLRKMMRRLGMAVSSAHARLE